MHFRSLSPLLLILILPVTISACATTYAHPTKNASRFEGDEADCRRTAQSVAAKKVAAGRDCSVCDEIDRCLKMKGWKISR
jgi:hypothetical protein